MFESPGPNRDNQNESKTEIIDSLLKFSEYLISRWPQVDPTNNSLNYYIGGSLAPMLLSKAVYFVELDPEKLPQIAEIDNREIPPTAKSDFLAYTRAIGDLDYVPMDHYRNHPHRLKRGGGGPSFTEIPPEGQLGLMRSENQVKLMCDPVEVYGTDKIAKICVENKDYYINQPPYFYFSK